MDNMTLLIEFCRAALKITKPIEIRIKTHASRGAKDLAGYCEERLRMDKPIGFIIVLNSTVIRESGYSMLDVLAHEFIHACQLENGFFSDESHHDETFQRLAYHLKEGANEIGIPLGELYNPEVDTD
jgi:hypothetical protein